MPRRRIPKSPEELRAAKAARQARWRANAKAKAEIDAAVDAATGTSGVKVSEMPVGDGAAYIRARLMAAIAAMPDDQLLRREYQPAIANLLRAVSVEDARQKAKPVVDAGHVFALIQMTEAPRLDDGRTLEGEAIDVTPE